MYTVLPESKNGFIYMRIEGGIGSQDAKTLLPYLKYRIEQHGAIRVLIELKDFTGVETLGILRTLPFSLKYGKHIEKKAFVADEKWVHTWVHLLSPLSKTKVRCFPCKKRD